MVGNRNQPQDLNNNDYSLLLKIDDGISAPKEQIKDYRADITPEAISDDAKFRVLALLFEFVAPNQSEQLLPTLDFLSAMRVKGLPPPNPFPPGVSTKDILRRGQDKTLGAIYLYLESLCEEVRAYADDATQAWDIANTCSELSGAAHAFALFGGSQAARYQLSRMGTDGAHAENRRKKQAAFDWLDANPPKPRGKANAARHIASAFHVSEETANNWRKKWEKRGGCLPVEPPSCSKRHLPKNAIYPHHCTTQTKSAKAAQGGTMETIFKITQTKQAAGYKSNASIYNLVNEGLFTKPVKLGARAVGWPSSEIEAINAARIAGASTAQIRELVGKLHAKRKELLPMV